MLLTLGNLKLGADSIWGFAVPAVATCPGATETCKEHCYARRLERTREKVLAAHARNWEASKKPGFVRRVVAEIVASDVKVLRVSTFGDLYSPGYARKWLRVMRQCPKTRFWLYTRSFRVPAIREVLVQMARLRNVRMWWSLDRDCPAPPCPVPRRVRLAYMQVDKDDLPPAGSDLVFRIRRLRGTPAKKVAGIQVCPAEDGVTRKVKMTCGKCGICWRK